MMVMDIPRVALMKKRKCADRLTGIYYYYAYFVLLLFYIIILSCYIFSYFNFLIITDLLGYNLPKNINTIMINKILILIDYH